MAKTLRFDCAATVTHSDPTAIVPTSATCKFMTADGKDAALTGSVTLPTVSTTVGLPVPPDTFAVSNPYNFNGGGSGDPMYTVPPSDGITFAFGADSFALSGSSGGTPNNGDGFTVAFDAADHTATYTSGTLADLCTALAATMSADPNYDATGNSSSLTLTAKNEGVSVATVTATTSSNNTTVAVVHTTPGVDPVSAVADSWTISPGGSGSPADGNTFTVAIDGTPYVATYHAPDDPSVLFNDLVTAIAADPNYSASLGQGVLFVTAKVAGVRSSVITSATDAIDVTFTSDHTTPGVDPVAGVHDVWTVSLTVSDSGVPPDLSTNGFFVGYWLQAGTQYRRVSSHTYTDIAGTFTIALGLDTTYAAPYDAWQTGTPNNTTSISLYQHGGLVAGVAPASGSTKAVVKVVDPSGVTVGDPYLIVSNGVPVVVIATRLTGHAVTISPSLDVIPSDGCTFQGLKMSVAIAAPTKSLLGTGHRLQWEYTDGDTNRQHVETVTVARWIPDPPITAEAVKALLAAYQPSSANVRDQVYLQGIADRVAAKIEQALNATGRRQACYGDPNAFSEPGRTCARLYLADDAFFPAGASPDAYLKECQMRLEQELRLAVAGLQYDDNGDGAITGDEKRPKFFTFKVSL